MSEATTLKKIATSTVSRGKSFSCISVAEKRSSWSDGQINLYQGDSLDHYDNWEKPTTIISDGAYGILGFEGDTSDHMGIPNWYEPHVKKWSEAATAQTTLWFWNSEIGWAAAHPILEKHGWRYVNCNTWNKGKGHIAGNVNTSKIRRFPVVSEVCVQYVFEAKIDNHLLKDWLRNEWKRTGLPMKKANEACGVKDAATRKYFDKGHLWYFPPPEVFEKMALFANTHGNSDGKPYFSLDGIKPMTALDWEKMRAKFNCPHGFTNIWERGSLRGSERIKAPKTNSKAAHLNQKPLDLMRLIIEASTDEGDVVWEPFGGLFSASLAASMLNRKAYASELDPDYFNLGLERFRIPSLL
jgi:site-specific DNA-methyltransferase (adenine-specific)